MFCSLHSETHNPAGCSDVQSILLWPETNDLHKPLPLNSESGGHSFCVWMACVGCFVCSAAGQKVNALLAPRRVGRL